VASIGVSYTRCPGNLAVTQQGELDISQAERLGRALAAAAVCGARIIVDLAERRRAAVMASASATLADDS
jgi:hypothetical protein